MDEGILEVPNDCEYVNGLCDSADAAISDDGSEETDHVFEINSIKEDDDSSEDEPLIHRLQNFVKK